MKINVLDIVSSVKSILDRSNTRKFARSRDMQGPVLSILLVEAHQKLPGDEIYLQTLTLAD